MKSSSFIDYFAEKFLEKNTIVDKKTSHLLELFLTWSYLCELLRLRWKIDIIGERRSWTLSRYLVCSYFHFFKRYWCVFENGTLCSQSRLIHFLTPHFKNFCLCKVSVMKIILQNFLQKIRVVIVPFWSFNVA